MFAKEAVGDCGPGANTERRSLLGEKNVVMPKAKAKKTLEKWASKRITNEVAGGIRRVPPLLSSITSSMLTMLSIKKKSSDKRGREFQRFESYKCSHHDSTED